MSNTPQPPEGISLEKLQTLLITADAKGTQPLNGKDLKEEVTKLIEELDDLQKRIDAFVSCDVQPQRWRFFMQGKHYLRLAKRHLKKSIHI